MSIPPIIIAITDKNIHLLYDIDFDYFKTEINKLDAVEITDNYCFNGVLLIGLKVKCKKTNGVKTIKKFIDLFLNRWKIQKRNITVNFNNKQNFLDYQY